MATTIADLLFLTAHGGPSCEVSRRAEGVIQDRLVYGLLTKEKRPCMETIRPCQNPLARGLIDSEGILGPGRNLCRQPEAAILTSHHGNGR